MYRDKSVGVLKVRPATEVAFFKDDLWMRSGSESVQVPAGPPLVEVIGRFA